MARFSFLLLVTLHVAGCGQDDDLRPGCTLAIQGAATPGRLSEGGRARFALVKGESVDSVALGSFPSGFRGRLAGDELTLEPPYGARGRVEIPVDLRCDGAATSAALSFEVHALRWQELTPWTPGEDGPADREYGAMWIDSGDPDRLLLFGGFLYEPQQFTPSWELWQLDLASESWTELVPDTEPPHGPGGRMVPLPGVRANLYYGGLLTDGQEETPYSLVRVDYGSATPTFAAAPAGKPKATGDYLPATVLDAPRGRLITACGVSVQVGYHCDVHAYDLESGAWKELHPAGDDAPDGRNGMFFVHDAENERLVLFSGDRGAAGGACDCAQDTWALELGEDPVRWVKLAGPQHPPIGRRNGAYALDPEGHRMFAWGGTPDGAATFPGLWAFDLDRGEEGWTEVDAGPGPPERTSGIAVYDAARRRVLMGFGNDASLYADLWSLDL